VVTDGEWSVITAAIITVVSTVIITASGRGIKWSSLQNGHLTAVGVAITASDRQEVVITASEWSFQC